MAAILSSSAGPWVLLLLLVTEASGFSVVGPPARLLRRGLSAPVLTPPRLAALTTDRGAGSLLLLRATGAAEEWGKACEENGVPATKQPLPLEDVKTLLNAAMSGHPVRADTFAEVGGGRGEVRY